MCAVQEADVDIEECRMTASAVIEVIIEWKAAQLFVALFLILTMKAFPQNENPDFKVSARSALVWDENMPDNSTSSMVLDPLTGRMIHRLSQDGIEVSSRMGYERVGRGEAGKLLNYTTTIANNTNSDLTVRYGAASVAGHAALPLRVASTKKGLPKRVRQDVWQLSTMHCFRTGFASTENYFSADALSKSFIVRPQTAMTISAVTKDPRSYPGRCSLEGCQITGAFRYYITVNGKDYVFIWSGPSMVYCGE